MLLASVSLQGFTDSRKYKIGKRQTNDMNCDHQNDAEKDPEKHVFSEIPQSMASGHVEFDAVSANQRLGYLDLMKPVERLTVREWCKDGYRR